MTGMSACSASCSTSSCVERADHDRVEVALEDGRRVLDRLTAPELKVAGREVEALASELCDADLERDARSRRRLLEDEPDHAAGQELVRLALGLELLQLIGEVEHGLQLVGVPASDAREVSALQVLRNLDHAARDASRAPDETTPDLSRTRLLDRSFLATVCC